MTKSQCSNEIVRNQALIAQYESEIRGYQEQISELQETKTKLGVLQEGCLTARQRAIQNWRKQSR